ncbi:MAG: hypothetical protein RR706_07605 [Muribaculaceae bacterium]
MADSREKKVRNGVMSYEGGVAGVEHLRCSSVLDSVLPHNCVRYAHYIMGLNFRTKVLK